MIPKKCQKIISDDIFVKEIRINQIFIHNPTANIDTPAILIIYWSMPIKVNIWAIVTIVFIQLTIIFRCRLIKEHHKIEKI